MDQILAATTADALKWPFFGSLGIIAIGFFIMIAGVVAMLRTPPPRTRAAEAPTGPWDIIKSIVGAFIGWGSKALKLFMDTARSMGERIVGLGLFVMFVGVLLAFGTAILWGVAAGLGGGEGEGDGTATPSPSPTP
jgi:hypothetical protein